MRLFKSCVLQTILICAVFSLEGRTFEQPAETVKGAVTLDTTGEPVHGATVILLGLGLHTTTDEDGQFVIKDVPLGTHQLLVEREHLTADRHEVIVVSGQTVTVSIPLTLSPIHESVTVTTSTRGAATTFEQFNAITSLDLFELSKDLSGNLGETLQNEAGVTKRGMGPASSRPVIRGFDGDRVLIMQDGIRTGDLSSQSADHNVSIDPASLERIEIIKGPATLLYGSNAVGGIVNAITPQDSFRTSQPQGMKGTVVLDGGTANSQLGGNANIHYGKGDFLAWAAAGSRKTDDYATPIGHIENSKSKLSNGNAGIGWFGPNRFFSIGKSRRSAYEVSNRSCRWSGESSTKECPPLCEDPVR